MPLKEVDVCVRVCRAQRHNYSGRGVGCLLQNRLIFVQSQNMLVAKCLVFILVLAYLFFDIYLFSVTLGG